MLKHILWIIVRPVTWTYLKNFYLLGMEHIPDDRPVILASNHPNSFLDGIMLNHVRFRSVFSMARGDAFKTALSSFLLKQINVIPIFRRSEGDLAKNNKTFQYCQEVLFPRNEIVLIFSEGNCVREKRVRSMRKGTARLYFETLEKTGIKPVIIPVGMNYRYFNRWRNNLIINIGQPIDMAPYEEIHRENSARAVSKFTQDLFRKVEDQVIAIHRKEDEQLAEQLFEIERNNHPEKASLRIVDDPGLFNREKTIANRINHLAEHAPEQLETLKEKASRYFGLLKQYGMTDQMVGKREFNALDIVILFFGILIAPLGLLIDRPPFRLARLVADNKTSPKSVFYDSVLFGSAMFIFALYFLLLLTVAGFFAGWWGVAGMAAFMIFGGAFVLYFLEVWDFLKDWRIGITKSFDRLDRLREARSELLTSLKEDRQVEA